MTWTLILVLIAFAIYALYNVIVVGTLGLPWSLSETFYRLKEKKAWLSLLCPIVLSLITVLALPEWISMSSHSALCILPIITTISIIGLEIVPLFKVVKWEKFIQIGLTILSLVLTVFCIIFVSKLWWVLLIWLCLIALVAVVTKTWKTSLLFWVETTIILSAFTSIILYHLI